MNFPARALQQEARETNGKKAPPSPKVLKAHQKISPKILERTDFSAVLAIPQAVLMDQIDFLACQFLERFKLALDEGEHQELLELLAEDLAAAAGLPVERAANSA